MRHSKKKELLRLIEEFTPKQIMVIGDVMLDKYTWGEVERISPEAPIPVIKVTQEEYRLGGSASVVANLKALDCQVTALGLIGQDEAGRKIRSIFEGQGIASDCLLSLPDRPTILKDRVLTSQQQLIRVDHEKELHFDARQEMGLIKLALERLPQMDALVLSDYAKGVLSKNLVSTVIAEAKKKGIPVISDPGKGQHYSLYEGTTTIKPNRAEAEMFTGLKLKDEESILKAAGIIFEACKPEFLSLSLDKDGILLYRSPSDYQFIETDVIEVYDVTGAGDMVISMISCMLAQQVEPSLALAMANVAAEIEISHMGVVAIPWKDVRNFLLADELGQKVVTLEELLAQNAKDPGIQLVFTNGYFDNISAGHLRFLYEAGKIPGRLILAINSDACIERQKGQRPLLSERERARLLASIESVWKVVIFEEDDASRLIEAIGPQVVVKGDRFKDQRIPEAEAIEKVGAEIRHLSHFSYD